LAVVLQGVGSDPDGDALSWSLDFGDESAEATGTALPADVAHDYAAGSHTATLTVTDGRGGSAVATVAITVVPAYSLAIDLSVTAGCAACLTGPGASASVITDTSGIDANWVALPAEAAGHTFSVTGSDPSVAFTAACAAGQDVLQLFATMGSESGIVPAGAGCLYVWKGGLFGATFTVSIT
jgi:PKD repeat protein